jgi:hypothetical protein
LVKKLRAVSDAVYTGIGFKVVHGLDPTKYTEKQNAIIYAGVASHVGSQRGFQDRDASRVLGMSSHLPVQFGRGSITAGC